MMEVKQNTAVDLNDLLTSPKNSGTDEVDDAVMSDLTDRTHALVKCDLIKASGKIANAAELENGDVAMVSLISDVNVNVDADVDLNTTVNSELEDALLAEDDVMPKITSSKENDPTSSVADDILADKVETSNSTTSSNNVRDPGDDLDTLLSKINDIVDDCIDNDVENTAINTLKSEQAINKSAEILEENNFVEESKVNDKSGVKGEEKSDDTIKPTINNDGNSLEHTEVTEKATKEETMFSDLPTITQVHENNIVEDNKEIKQLDTDEKDTSIAEIQLDAGKASSQENYSDTKLEDNQNLDKTEELNAEVVQDNEITSNSNEIFEAVKTHSPSNVDKMSSTEDSDTAQIKVASQNTDNAVENTETTQSKCNEKTLTEDTKNSESVENYDSDDEIVFYVDKPPEIEKPKETETKLMETEAEKNTTTSATENSTSQKEKSSSPKKIVEDDDDIVLLLDDEDEEVDQIKKGKQSNAETSFKKKEEQQVSEEVNTFKDPNAAIESKDIDIDNSDNARDDFLNETSNENDKSVDKLAVAEIPEETNSNCSSSSNLLQEAKSIKTAVDEPPPEEPENDEEDDEGDVELIESEQKVTDTSEKVEDSELAPPAKRIRLSEDSESERSSKTEESNGDPKDDGSPNAVENKKESQEIMEEEKSSEATSSAHKRSHDVIEVEAEDKSNDSKVSNEGIKKKARTDDLKTETEDSSEKPVEIEDDKPSEVIKSEQDDKKDIKAVPSYQPIPLYPPPKFQVFKHEPTISLDFLKKFRKSFDNMTKQDLEELVLQKVVEAIIHRSEFSEMRELIEKQEKLITAHRSKISELSKQFRDLEMVHNRVVKDIEQRNSQFIMPVKITRAVGLQVYIPNKKSITETASSSSGPNVPTSPQRPVSSQAVASSTTLNPPQRQYIASQTETQPQQRSGPTASSVTGNTGSVRRGCVQKITPIRPVPGANQSSSSAGPTTTSAAYRNTANHSPVTQPRILNKNATPVANPTSIQRSRYLGSNQDGQRIPSQQNSRTPSIPASSQRAPANAAAQPKPSSTVATAVQRRSEHIPPTAAASSSSSIVDNYINTLTHLTGGNTAVSITPAKPKEKAVIDLTDEDETPGQTPSVQPATQVPVTQVPRRSLPVQNSQLQYGRAAPPLARIPPANQMANNKNRQMSSLQAQKSAAFASINTPPGTSITRINVPPNVTSVQRVKYSHPAPLPATPPQAFNPSWKLPPPRPTIRISNLDNGIVISWTMEESMDRHAECVSYQIYAYQETSGPPMVDSWRHVGDVKAMLLPMAVTLTQFQEGQRYYFAVRAVDCHQRFGPFSLPKTWS